MWPVSDAWEETIRGSHEVTLEASAWYGQECTVKSLSIVSGSVEYSQGEEVRTKVSLVVQDPDGTLTPRRITDPLSPFGQRLFIRLGLTVGRHTEWLPLGWFRIDSVSPTGGWARVGERWVPTGGEVTLECSDMLGVLLQDQWERPMKPLKGNRTRAEIIRQVAGRIPVDEASIPDEALPDLFGGYEDNPMSNIKKLLNIPDYYPLVNRMGALTAKPYANLGDPVWRIFPRDNMVSLTYAPSREGLFNAVGSIGEGGFGESSVYGYAEESEGPLSVYSPLGRILRQQSSSWYYTTAQANKGANTFLRNNIDKRKAELTVETIFNPALDIMDVVEVVVQPDEAAPFTVKGFVSSMSYNLLGGAMTVGVTVRLEDMDGWTI